MAEVKFPTEQFNQDVRDILSSFSFLRSIERFCDLEEGDKFIIMDRRNHTGKYAVCVKTGLSDWVCLMDGKMNRPTIGTYIGFPVLKVEF